MKASQRPVLHLEGSAGRAARVIARTRLADVRAAYDALGPRDGDAMHDLRVALRRLRSWLRAYRLVLDDTVRRRTRRALSDLAGATNAARDAEVTLAWLRSQRDLRSEDKAGRAAFMKGLKEETASARGEAIKQLADRLPKVMRELDSQLAYYWLRVPLEGRDAEPEMAEVTARLVSRGAQRLQKSLGRVRSMADADAAHRGRIDGKRLRYLLEPFAGDRRITHVIERLTGLQESLGAFHDAQLVAERITRFRREEDLRPVLLKGLDELARRAQREQHTSFASYRRSWNARSTKATLAQVRAIAAAIRAETTRSASAAR